MTPEPQKSNVGAVIGGCICGVIAFIVAMNLSDENRRSFGLYLVCVAIVFGVAIGESLTKPPK